MWKLGRFIWSRSQEEYSLEQELMELTEATEDNPNAIFARPIGSTRRRIALLGRYPHSQ
jgi:hypothetical protein